MANVDDPFAMSNVLSTGGLVAIIVNSLIVVKYGRRRVLLMSGLLICGILQLIVALVYQVNPGTASTGKVIVALSSLYMFAYNGKPHCTSFIAPILTQISGMIATYAWLSGGEIPSQRLRSHTFGLAAAVGFAGAWLTTFTAPYFINPDSLNWGPRYGFIWFPSCTIAAIWVFFFLPEVKNRTLEEVTEMVSSIPASLSLWWLCMLTTTQNSLKQESRQGSSALTSAWDWCRRRTSSAERVWRRRSTRMRRPLQRSRSLLLELACHVTRAEAQLRD